MFSFMLTLFHTDGGVIAITGWGIVAFFMLIGAIA